MGTGGKLGLLGGNNWERCEGIGGNVGFWVGIMGKREGRLRRRGKGRLKQAAEV